MACVTLTTAENVILDVNITVEMNTMDDTGKTQVFFRKGTDLFLLLAMSMDYQSLMNEMVVFLVGDNNGTERCVNITIEEDMLVECEEEFNVTLTIITDKPNLILDQSTTIVSIIDSDGMIPLSHQVMFLIFFI